MSFLYEESEWFNGGYASLNISWKPAAALRSTSQKSEPGGSWDESYLVL